MKWFHHDCSAKHDPKLQTLGSSFGAEGLGIFWCLLEEIGLQSDTFHLKVSGIDKEKDTMYVDLCQKSGEECATVAQESFDPNHVPVFTIKLLARNLFTSQRRLQCVIEASVQAGLFDSAKWAKYNILYSSSFEQRADNYTRRVRRELESRRTFTAQCTESLHRPSEETQTSSDTDAEQSSPRTDIEQKENRNRKRTEQTNMDLESNRADLSTTCQQEHRSLQKMRVAPTQEEYVRYSFILRKMIAEWNHAHSVVVKWVPTDFELHRLFYGGQPSHKQVLCERMSEVEGRVVEYPEIVLGAARRMLESSRKTRVANPVGWIWTCLHGNGGTGTGWLTPVSSNDGC